MLSIEFGSTWAKVNRQPEPKTETRPWFGQGKRVTDRLQPLLGLFQLLDLRRFGLPAAPRPRRILMLSGFSSLAMSPSTPIRMQQPDRKLVNVSKMYMRTAIYHGDQ